VTHADQAVGVERQHLVDQLAAMVAVALQPRSLFLFLAIWTSQHWILASGLMSRTPGLEPTPAGRMRRLLHAVNSRGWALAAFVMLVSVILLPLFERFRSQSFQEKFWEPGALNTFAFGLRKYLAIAGLGLPTAEASVKAITPK